MAVVEVAGESRVHCPLCLGLDVFCHNALEDISPYGGNAYHTDDLLADAKDPGHWVSCLIYSAASGIRLVRFIRAW
jgi:hypothetical protein